MELGDIRMNTALEISIKTGLVLLVPWAFVFAFTWVSYKVDKRIREKKHRERLY